LEPPVFDRSLASFLEKDEPWFEQRMAGLDKTIRARLDDLAAHLGDDDWVAGEFSAADILMVTTLRRLLSTNILDDYPTLTAYIARAEARPAYRRAFDDQLAVFTAANAG
ncbi:MAG: glutathione S-transferase family protein, partial [Caulobacteraceae bacterium]